jgi:hypothetical protein
MAEDSPSDNLGVRDQVACLQAELVAIAFWDQDYETSPHHTVLDQMAFQARQLRAQEIVSRLKELEATS